MSILPGKIGLRKRVNKILKPLSQTRWVSAESFKCLIIIFSFTLAFWVSIEMVCIGHPDSLLLWTKWQREKMVHRNEFTLTSWIYSTPVTYSKHLQILMHSHWCSTLFGSGVHSDGHNYFKISELMWDVASVNQGIFEEFPNWMVKPILLLLSGQTTPQFGLDKVAVQWKALLIKIFTSFPLIFILSHCFKETKSSKWVCWF